MKSIQEAAREIVEVIKPDEFFNVTETVHRIDGGPPEGTHEFHVFITPNSNTGRWHCISVFNPSLDVAVESVLAQYREGRSSGGGGPILSHIK